MPAPTRMRSSAKSGFLLVAILLMIFGGFCLRGRLGPLSTTNLENGTGAATWSQPVEFWGNEPADWPKLPNISATPPDALPNGSDPVVALGTGFDSETKSPGPPPVRPVAFDAADDVPQPVRRVELLAPQETGPLTTVVADPELVPAGDQPRVAETAQASTVPASIVSGPDDSLWRVAHSVYGSGSYYKALYLHNRSTLDRPDRIPGGITIATPSAAELQRLYPQACPSKPNDKAAR